MDNITETLEEPPALSISELKHMMFELSSAKFSFHQFTYDH